MRNSGIGPTSFNAGNRHRRRRGSSLGVDGRVEYPTHRPGTWEVPQVSATYFCTMWRTSAPSVRRCWTPRDAHVVAVVVAQAQRQFAQIAGADDKAAVWRR